MVPNLFAKEELGGIYDSVRKGAAEAGCGEQPEDLWRYFIDRVRNNLHVVLAVSPIGDTLRNRCRMYPGLVKLHHHRYTQHDYGLYCLLYLYIVLSMPSSPTST